MIEWSISSPALICLPVTICFFLHILVSSGLLAQTHPGFYRFFVFIASSLFIIIYLLLFNYDYTLATTRILINVQGQYLELKNQYGTVQIPQESIEAVVVKGKPDGPETIWIITDLQDFYLDRNFAGYGSFLPALEKLVILGQPRQRGEQATYQVRPGNTDSAGTADYFNLSGHKNTLRGNTLSYLPWLGAMPFLFYFMGPKAWAGNTRYFIVLALLYFLPFLGLAFFLRPSLPLVIFILIYPLYLLLLGAVCFPEPAAWHSG